LICLKVILVPLIFCTRGKKIQVNENLGLFMNPQLSLLSAFALRYLLIYLLFKVMALEDKTQKYFFALRYALPLVGFS